MSSHEPRVFVVSGSLEVRTVSRETLAPLGFLVQTESSAAAYLSQARPFGPACVVVDTDLPDISGIDLLERVCKEATFIMVSRRTEIANSVRAMRAGAVDYLLLPLDRSALLKSVSAALALDRAMWEQRTLRAVLQERFHTLTPRERETAALVIRGWMNKHVAAELGISIVTVQIHRGSIMRKMGAKSVAELVRMMDMLGLIDPTFAERLRARTSRNVAVAHHALYRETRGSLQASAGA